MKVKLYKNFKKRKNSTLRPSGDFLEIDCTLKNGTSIVNPTIQLQLAFDSDYSNYNYCQIPDFGRFYYIRDLVWNNSIAEFVLVSDKMASFKTDIGAFTGLAVRVSSNVNLYLPDGAIRKTDEISRTTRTTNITPSAPPYSYALYYFVTVLNETGIYYYMLTYASYSSLISQVASWWGGAMDKAAGVLKIQCTRCSPTWLNAVAAPDTIQIGWGTNIFNISGSGCYQVAPGCTNTTITSKLPSASIANHPQSATYGKFLNDVNYRTITLFSPLFGKVPLNATADMTGQLRIDMSISNVTGDALFSFFIGGEYAGIANGGLFCDMPTIGNNVNVSGIASGAAGAATGVGAIAAATSPAGAIAAGIGAGVSAVGGALSAIPQHSATGRNGSALSLGLYYTIVEEFALVRDNDNNNQGRPYCGQYTASSGGYIEYDRVNLSTTARADEKSEIETIMERGFYYE